jgi:hypothetical protein
MRAALIIIRLVFSKKLDGCSHFSVSITNALRSCSVIFQILVALSVKLSCYTIRKVLQVVGIEDEGCSHNFHFSCRGGKYEFC